MVTDQTIMLEPYQRKRVSNVDVVGYDPFLDSPVLDVGGAYSTLDRAQRAALDEDGIPKFSESEENEIWEIVSPITQALKSKPKPDAGIIP